jgi:hypothetical protein
MLQYKMATTNPIVNVSPILAMTWFLILAKYEKAEDILT